MGIRVSGIGGYVPAKTITNFDLAMAIDTSNEWIISRTGILERRVAGPDEAPSDLGCQAALRCLTNAGIDKTAVDLIIVACATPDQSQPATENYRGTIAGSYGCHGWKRTLHWFLCRRL